MPTWLLILIALALAALALVLWQRRARNWARLRQVLEALGEGREPVSYVFVDGGNFARLTDMLERVARQQEAFRKMANDERFNLRTILASMEEGVMVVDSQHVLRLVNPSFIRLFGLGGNVIGQTVLSTLREPAFDETITSALRDSEPQTREVMVTSGKTNQYFAVHAVPMRDSSGERSVMTIFRDVSRLRQLEEVRREFVANVSHELRTPLSIFHGYVETLLDNPELPRPEITAILEILLKHSFRLNALVEDLLILARLESRRDEMQFESLDITEFVNSILRDWARKAGSKNVELRAELPPNLPEIEADPLRMEQVLNNLIDNAMKYTPAGGRITVCAALYGDQIEIAVRDNGAGILPADLPHIFERFYRADKARSREQGGTGLGLSIVKHIVQSHGGLVRAESVYGKGAAIILNLPLTHDAPIAQTAPQLIAV